MPFKKGQNNAYREKLDKMSIAELNAHKAERAARKEKKKLEEEFRRIKTAMIENQIYEWASAYNNALATMAMKAMQGDVQAFTALSKALEGKGDLPEQQVDNNAVMVEAIRDLVGKLPD